MQPQLFPIRHCKTVDLIGTIGERRLKDEFHLHNFNTALVCNDIARPVFEQKIRRALEVRTTMGFTVGVFWVDGKPKVLLDLGRVRSRRFS